MGSALLNQIPRHEADTETGVAVESSSDALRQQVAERLAAHRSRRAHAHTESSQAPLPRTNPAATGSQKSRIAATVAERYAQAQSYRGFLAAEAERAVQQARAAAEIAARNAEAVAQARQELLDTLAHQQQQDARPFAPGEPDLGSAAGTAMLWPELGVADKSQVGGPADHQAEEAGMPRVASAAARPRSQRTGKQEVAAAPARAAEDVSRQHTAPGEGGLRVVLYEELPAKAPVRVAGVPDSWRADQPGHSAGLARQPWDEAEALALDAEISFRQAPVFEEPAGPPMPLAANLIEFPRQLVASRKARPRYAEGPLRDEDTGSRNAGQLRIFEVESTQISTSPGSVEMVETAMAQWTSLWLDTPSGAGSSALGSPAPVSQAHTEPAEWGAAAYMATAARPQTAPLPRRVLSAAVDGAVVGAAALTSGAGFAAITGYLADPGAGWSMQTLRDGLSTALQGVPMVSGLLAAGVSFGCLALAYQLLFFTFSDRTPGMRLTRIGLCTFSDDNPSRRAMRLRVLGLVLSTVTLGLGHLWALLDEDRLTWHDHISRMYPRSY